MSARHCAPVILRLWPMCIFWVSSLSFVSCSAKAEHPVITARHREAASSPITGSSAFVDDDGLILEHRDGADRRAGALAPFQRQADELEFAFADERLEIAQALDVSDVELEAGLVHQRIDHALGPRPHRVDAEVHDTL